MCSPFLPACILLALQSCRKCLASYLNPWLLWTCGRGYLKNPEEALQTRLSSLPFSEWGLSWLPFYNTGVVSLLVFIVELSEKLALALPANTRI